MTIIDLPPRVWGAGSPVKLELYDGADLATARWPSLDADPDLRMYVFQSREFLDVWMDTIGRAAGIEGYLIAARDDAGRPLFYLPLVIETRFNVRLVRFMDAGVADYNAPIVAAGYAPLRQEFAALWSQLLSLLPGFDAVDLTKIPSDVAGAFNPLTYLDCTADGDSGHWLSTDLRGEIETRHAMVTLRRKLRRFARGLSKLGEANFCANPPGVRSAEVLARLFELKRRKYQRTKVPDFLAAPGVEDFYRAMAAPGRLGRIGHLSALTVGDTVVSAHLGFIGRGRFHYILPAFDTAYQRYRPGHLLLAHLIDGAGEQGFDAFDLGVGDASYKETWASHRLALYSHERAVTAAGALYLQMRRVRRLVRSAGIGAWLGAAS